MPEFAKLNLMGDSAEFKQSLNSIARFARNNSTVLILGESGTGKELAARAIHAMSGRRENAFVPVNCGAVPDHLVESEFFGHVKGAYPEARQGLVMKAKGGTLFLDEIEAMSPRTQVALLRFLQSKEFRPVGGERISNADIRIIAASNADLFAKAADGAFRLDLLYRLNVLVLNLPPLRSRGDDVSLLAKAFVERLNRQLDAGEPVKSLDSESFLRLEQHDWPGNVRELENVIQQEFVNSAGPVIRIRQIGNPASPAVPRVQDQFRPRSGFAEKAGAFPNIERRLADRRRSSVSNLKQGPGFEGELAGSKRLSEVLTRSYDDFREVREAVAADLEKKYLQVLMQRANGNLSLASRLAGKDRSNLYKLLKKHGIQPGQEHTDRVHEH